MSRVETIGAAIFCLMLTACGEWPHERQDRERREDTLRWLEQQELKRQRDVRPDPPPQ